MPTALHALMVLPAPPALTSTIKMVMPAQLVLLIAVYALGPQDAPLVNQVTSMMGALVLLVMLLLVS